MRRAGALAFRQTVGGGWHVYALEWVKLKSGGAGPAITCSQPTTPSGTWAFSNSNIYGSVATAGCNAGFYQSSGNKTYTCGGGALVFRVRHWSRLLTRTNMITTPMTHIRASEMLCWTVATIAPWGIYKQPSLTYANGIWYDQTGNGRSATGYNANPTISGSMLAFTTSQAMRWPAGSIPASFTIFVRAQYTAGSQARIFQGSTNWLLGWWGGISKVACKSARQRIYTLA